MTGWRTQRIARVRLRPVTTHAVYRIATEFRTREAVSRLTVAGVGGSVEPVAGSAVDARSTDERPDRVLTPLASVTSRA